MKLGYEKLRIVPKEDKSFSISKFIDFLKGDCEMNIVPVRGQYDKYWLSGVSGYDMIDGNKYYKLGFDGRVLSIECVGGFNAFAIKGNIKDWIKEGIKKRKASW